MDLITRARRNLRGETHSEWGSSAIPRNSDTRPSAGFAGESGALAISTVMACVRVLHDDVAILPFGAFTGDKHGVKSPIRNRPPIVAEPFGPDLPPAAGMGQIVVSLKLRGNAFVQGMRFDRDGFPTQVRVVHPDQVKVDYRDPLPFTIGRTQFSSHEVRHIRGMMLPGADLGIDPLSYQRLTLRAAAEVAEFGANFFGASATPSGVISVPGSGDRKKAREVKEAWEAGHSGVANAHRPAVMFGGATWTPIAVTPENAQFLETRMFLREEICGWFGVPLQRIQAIVDNASQGGGKGLDSIDQGYATHTLLPITSTIEAAWDSMIPGGQGTWCGFDFRGLLRASALERAQIQQLHRLTGVRNRDEIRAEEGWAPIGGLDGQDYNAPFNTNSRPVEPGADDKSGDSS